MVGVEFAPDELAADPRGHLGKDVAELHDLPLLGEPIRVILLALGGSRAGGERHGEEEHTEHRHGP